jgi:hypothetical protein
MLIAWIQYYLAIDMILKNIGTWITWTTIMYRNKHTRQKSLRKYMKFWRSTLARLNSKFDSYIKENYKVVDYGVRRPSCRERSLTRRPYGYYRRLRINNAHRRCIDFKRGYVIEAKAATQKRKKKLGFDSGSFEILIDNCCSHSLTNSKEDFIDAPSKSKIKQKSK